MTIQLELNGVKVNKEIPTSWDGVNFKKFIGLSKCGDDTAKIISLFTEVDEQTVRKAKIVNLDLIITALGFLQTPVDDKTIPSKILGYKMPNNLSFETIGQFEDLKDELKEKVEDDAILERYKLFCAVYACPSKYGEYDWEKAKDMMDEFDYAPCGEVLAIGNFTLLKLIGLKTTTKSSSLNLFTRLKRLKLVLKGWTMRLGLPGLSI